MLTRFKSVTDEKFSLLGKKIYKIGLTPNRLTILGLLLTCIAGWLLFNEEILTAVILFIVGGLADGLDGIVARATENATLQGGFLDSVVDRYSDLIIIGAILLGGWIEPLGNEELIGWFGEISGEAWALGALSGALLTSYVRAAAERLGVKQGGIGLVERQERYFILVFGLAAGFVTFSLVILTFAGHLTVIHRAVHFWKNSSSEKKAEDGDTKEEMEECEKKFQHEVSSKTDEDRNN